MDTKSSSPTSPEAGVRAVELAELRDLIRAEREVAGHRFWRQLFPAGGATILAGSFALIDDTAAAWILAVGFFVMTVVLLRWHLRSSRRIDELRSELSGLLAEPDPRPAGARDGASVAGPGAGSGHRGDGGEPR